MSSYINFSQKQLKELLYILNKWNENKYINDEDTIKIKNDIYAILYINAIDDNNNDVYELINSIK